MVDEDLSNFVLEEEEYIDDIPFDTEMVFYDIMSEESLDQFALTEEKYIDDIPFNTELIAQNFLIRFLFICYRS